MDQQTVELLRVLQSGERSTPGFAEIESLLEPQRRALHAADDRASLADISELLEVWSDGAPAALAAAATAHAARIAEQDLEQSERAVALYGRSIELDPSQASVLDRLEVLFKQLAQHDRFDAVLVKAADALRAGGEASADDAAATLRRLGKLRLQLKSGVDGAVSAYEQALELSADVELIRELADLYAQRRADGDVRQAADLYATLAEVQGAESGTPLLERALDLIPGHLEALSLLESFVPEAERAERLKDRWVAFVKDSEDEPAAAERMIALARASAARGEYHSVLEWVAPGAERGDSAALELQAQALAAIQQLENAEQPTAEGQPQGTATRPPTLVGFRVPVGSAPTGEGNAGAPGARKPKKARSGDTIVGFRVPEELAATHEERQADRSANHDTAPALRGGASLPNPLDAAFASAKSAASAAGAKSAASKPASSKPAAGTSPSRSTNGGIGPATASNNKRPSPAPVAASASKSASAAKAAAPAAAATLSPAQRSEALRKSTPPPAMSGTAPARAVPAAEPAAPAPISTSPAAAHAAALRATTPSAPVAGTSAAQAAATALVRASAAPGIQTPAASAAAAALSMQARTSSPPPLARGSQPSTAHAQAIGAAAVQAPAPLPVPVHEPYRREDELSGVRARPTLLDKRVLAIGAAVAVVVIGAFVMLRGKPTPSTPPAASADATPAEEPPAPAPSAAPAPATGTAASAVGTGASASATGSTPSAALPSALAAAVAPPAPAAPAHVAPEPTQGRVEVQVAEIRIKGGKLKTKDVLGALGENLQALQHCYEEVLEDHPRTTGTLSFGFTIDKKGNPTKVKKAGGTIKDARVLKCTQRAIDKTDFPKPAKGKPAEVTLPLEFKKG